MPEDDDAPPLRCVRGNRFEFFGFDVLPDAALRPWLLEVNGQPHLGASGRGGGKVFEAEHEAKGRSIAGALSVAMTAAAGVCSEAELDALAASGGFERLVEEPGVGEQWWGDD